MTERKEYQALLPSPAGNTRVSDNLRRVGRRAKYDRPRPGARRTALAVLLLAAAAVVATACRPMARPSAPATTDTGGAPPAPAPNPAPILQETEKRWTLGPAHFRDDGGVIMAETSNRSAPFTWDRITAGNAAAVRVSIDGKELPLDNRSYQPLFDGDFTGAEWKLDAEVGAGAVVLVLTAPDQRVGSVITSVTVTNGGSGYTSVPTVTFSPAPSGGTTATGTAVGPFGTVGEVTVSTAGTGYTSAPTVTLSAPTAGATAAGTAVLQSGVASVTITDGGNRYNNGPPTVIFGSSPGGTTAGAYAVLGSAGSAVASVTIWRAGSGYTSAPSVTFTFPIRFYPGGTGLRRAATGTAVLQSGVASVTLTNAGSGYTSAPSVTFSAPTAGTTAAGAAVLQDSVTAVTLTDAGSGYVSPPAVTFTHSGGGSGATAVAKVASRGNSQQDNLYGARRTLYGKELLVQIVDE